MMENFESYEKIEKYLRGGMSQAEAEQFEKRLDEDRLLQEELELHQELHHYFQRRESLSTFRNNLKQSKRHHRPFTSRKLIRILGIAATIMITAGFSFWIYSFQNSPDQLYKKYFDEPDYLLNATVLTEREQSGDDSVLRNSYSLARKSYEEKDYSAALNHIDRLTNKEASFHRGVIYMKMQRWDEAIAAFDNAQDIRPDASTWFTSLCHLKMGNTQQSKELLETLSVRSNRYQDNAKRIVQKLK